jgi:hypothetical protein
VKTLQFIRGGFGGGDEEPGKTARIIINSISVAEIAVLVS